MTELWFDPIELLREGICQEKCRDRTRGCPCTAIADELVALRARRDDLLASNNRELERRRAAEGALRRIATISGLSPREPEDWPVNIARKALGLPI